MVTAAHAAAGFRDLEFVVAEMDCAQCARNVEGALEHLAGVSSVNVNFTTQKLRLTIDEAVTSGAAVERALASIGYPARPAAAATLPTVTPWHQTGKGRFVIATGLLFVLSAVLALVYPPAAPWGFTAATLLGVAPLARKAVASARLGKPFSINTLISVAAIGAIAIGEAPEGALVVFLFAVGELLESVATGRARAGIRSLAALAPTTALRLTGDKAQQVPVAELRPGDLIRVQPGGRVPADGTIVTGTAGMDESPVTGESMPISKGAGDSLFAGSISTDAVLSVRVERAASDSTISRIIHLVEEAEASKAPVARFIDRFSSVYTPAAMLVALLVATVPPLLFGAVWGDWIYRALALLLIACPCALVLSVPAAVTSGIAAGARRGLLVKGGSVLEGIGQVRTVAFDKTGTLTANQPQVTDVIPLNVSSDELLAFAAAIETGSAHPLARAITERAEGLQIPAAAAAKAIPGKAVTAIIGGSLHAVGSPRYAASLAPLDPELRDRIGELEEQGKTVVVLLRESMPLGLLAIRDEPRWDASDAVRRLHRLGVRSVMLTGDNARTGQAIATDIGLDVRSELLPEDKLRVIAELGRHGKVAMVGDGINDAPALAGADIGIAMGSGTDVALETADAALLRGNVTGVSDLVELSRATLSNIRQNVAFALGIKAIFLVTTLLGFTGLWPAILSDTGATVLVTANALRLLHFEPSGGNQ